MPERIANTIAAVDPTTGFRPYVALSLLCALLYGAGLAALPPTDRDEARFMQATKQMLETGDFVSIRFQEEPRNKKPAGIHWLQALSVAAFGGGDLTAPGPYRLPSALAAWLAVLATFRIGRRLFDPPTGLLAAAILATSLIAVIEAHLAKTDAALLAASAAAMGLLSRAYLSPPGRPPPLALVFGLWASIGAGMLIKGPVILLVVTAAIAALGVSDRSIAWLRGLRAELGLPIVIAMVLPWLLAMAAVGETDFLKAAFLEDIWPKLTGGQESHGAPPGAHALALAATAWPWSLFAPFALALAWRRRREPAVRFLLAWLVPCWLLLELMPTKLPHYTLPLFPALALLTARALRAPEALRALMGGRIGLAYAALWVLATLALAGVCIFAGFAYGPGASPAMAAAAGAAAAALAAAFAWSRTGTAARAAGLAACAAVFGAALFQGVLPGLEALALSPRLAAMVRAQDVPGPVALAGYHEPSAVFLLGTGTLLTGAQGAAAHLAATPGALAAVNARDLDAVAAALAQKGGIAVPRGVMSGYNYSRGEALTLHLLTATTKGPTPQP